MKKSILLQLSKYFDTIETIALLIFVGGMYMILNELEDAIKVIWFGLGSLTLLYWAMTLEAKGDNETNLAMIIRKLSWIGFTISIVGIIMKFQFDDKAELALLGGFLAVIATLIMTIFISIKEAKKLNIKNMVRAIIIAFICLFIYTL